MKNDRDKQQISILSKQISPYNSSYIIQSYQEATKKPYDYLLLDFRADSQPLIRARSNIFPHQFPCCLYIEK